MGKCCIDKLKDSRYKTLVYNYYVQQDSSGAPPYYWCTSIDLSKLEIGARINLELILCCQHNHNIYEFKNVLMKYIATIHSLFLIHSNTL